jgi:hypothetical protein
MDTVKEIQKLDAFIQGENFKGYDPYDVLNSWLPYKLFGKYGQSVAIQCGKWNPVNLRPLLGVKKDYNPKGLGLLLQAYCKLYLATIESKYLETATMLFNKIIELRSPDRKNYCWGYNFVWANPGHVLPKFYPSVVVSSFVGQGIFEYYSITKDKDAEEIINSIGKYILEELPVSETTEGICFSYTDYQKDCCYNASMLGAEMLARIYSLDHDVVIKDKIRQAINYVISHQNSNTGVWNYSINEKTGEERHQIDFHQGFILCSLYNTTKYCGILDDSKIDKALRIGLNFYKHNQFMPNGQSYWRVPKKYPVEIHNQAQGIITFSLLKDYSDEYLPFANTICQWTIDNMQSQKGYFYYRKFRTYTNKIPYMRWSQAWMMLALSYLVC